MEHILDSAWAQGGLAGVSLGVVIVALYIISKMVDRLGEKTAKEAEAARLEAENDAKVLDILAQQVLQSERVTQLIERVTEMQGQLVAFASDIRNAEEEREKKLVVMREVVADMPGYIAAKVSNEIKVTERHLMSKEDAIKGIVDLILENTIKILAILRDDTNAAAIPVPEISSEA